MEKRIKYSGAGLFWAGQAPKFKNSGRGVPWRKFWIGYHARSTTAISSGFLSFQVGCKFTLARRPQNFYSLFHPPVVWTLGRVHAHFIFEKYKVYTSLSDPSKDLKKWFPDLDRPGRLPHQQGLCEARLGYRDGSPQHARGIAIPINLKYMGGWVRGGVAHCQVSRCWSAHWQRRFGERVPTPFVGEFTFSKFSSFLVPLEFQVSNYNLNSQRGSRSPSFPSGSLPPRSQPFHRSYSNKHPVTAPKLRLLSKTVTGPGARGY